MALADGAVVHAVPTTIILFLLWNVWPGYSGEDQTGHWYGLASLWMAGFLFLEVLLFSFIDVFVVKKSSDAKDKIK